MEKPSECITGYFDFETYNLTNYKFGIDPLENGDKQEKTEKPIAVYGAGLLINDIAFTGFGTDAIDKFGKKLVEVAKGKKITLVAHNCSYDFALLNEYGHTSNCNIKSISAAQTDDDRAGLWARVEIDGVNIQFQDTGIGDRNCSLGYYSDILGVEGLQKGKLDHYEKGNFHKGLDGNFFFYDSDGELTKFDLQAEKEYLLGDILLLPKVREYIYKTKKLILGSDFIPPEEEWITPFEAINRKITKAGFAKTCFEQCIGDFFHNSYKVPISEDFYLEQLRSYIGGFTSGNKDITALNLDTPRIKSYDVNSLYPSVMAGYLPVGEVSYVKPKGPHCIWYRISGTYTKYKEKYEMLDCPIISVKFQEGLKLNKKALDSNKIINLPTFIILKEYFDVIDEYCEHDLEIEEILYQQTSNELAPHIEEAYNLRVLVKKNNKDLADSIKLFLNSGYGKFGEKTHEKVNLGDEEKGCGTKVKAPKAEYFTNLLTGLYVCSMARVKLMLAIKDEIENGNTFLYCDTDSIKLVENNPVRLEVDPDKLGAGKDEGCFDVWRYPLKRKRYYSYNTQTKEEKITCGGFNKSILKDLTYQDKLDFFNPELNTVILGGKRVKYTGQIMDTTSEQPIVPYLNKYGLTKLYEIDISSTNSLKNPNRIIRKDKESGKGVMEKVNG